MLQLFAFLVPIGLGSSLSPVMLTEQVVLLTTRRGRPAAIAYAAGVVTVTVVLIIAVLTLGGRLQLPSTPQLDATLDLWLGCGLLIVAAALVLWRRRHRDRPKRQSRPVKVDPPAAYAFGLFSMATNFTSIALLLPAAKEISSSTVTTPGKVVAALVLLALASLAVWGPVVLVAAAPTTGESVLRWLQRAIERYGATVIVVALTAVGVFLVGRGTYRLESL